MNYPFMESLKSAMPIVDEMVLNLGDSSDDTENKIAQLKIEFPEKLKILHSSWNTKEQSAGNELKTQTDLALSQCNGEWCLYLQSDEVLHEKDYLKIKIALQKAQARPEIEGLVFDWLHFYGNYDHIIKGRSWYRREVRVIRNHRGITAFRDAQGFRRQKMRLKALMSGAQIFHYGHVQSFETNQERRNNMAVWWGEEPDLLNPKLKYFRHTGIRRFRATHPKIMKERILHSTQLVNPLTRPRSWTLREWQDRVTLSLEAIIPYRIGEFRNYDLKR